MKNNFKESIKSNINSQYQNVEQNNSKGLTSTDDININKDENADNSSTLFTISKKLDDKKSKKIFNVYMEPNLVKELDKVSKRTGWSRNELINKMCDFCIKNINIEE